MAWRTGVAWALACWGPLAWAAPQLRELPEPRFNGPDFSGSYQCKGIDHRKGAFTGTLLLVLVKSQSTGRFGVYGVHREVAGQGAREGHMASDGNEAAMHLEATGGAEPETGIVRFMRSGRAGAWKLARFYVEPGHKGGNHGQESCVQVPDER